MIKNSITERREITMLNVYFSSFSLTSNYMKHSMSFVCQLFNKKQISHSCCSCEKKKIWKKDQPIQKILFAVSTDNNTNLLNKKCLIEYSLFELSESIAKMKSQY